LYRVKLRHFRAVRLYLQHRSKIKTHLTNPRVRLALAGLPMQASWQVTTS
jgi:hypothetical protein